MHQPNAGMRHAAANGLRGDRHECGPSGAQRRLPCVRRLPVVASGRRHSSRWARACVGRRGGLAAQVDEARTMRTTVGRSCASIDDTRPQQRLPARPRRRQRQIEPHTFERWLGRQRRREGRARRRLAQRIEAGERVGLAGCASGATVTGMPAVVDQRHGDVECADSAARHLGPCGGHPRKPRRNHGRTACRPASGSATAATRRRRTAREPRAVRTPPPAR